MIIEKRLRDTEREREREREREGRERKVRGFIKESISS